MVKNTKSSVVGNQKQGFSKFFFQSVVIQTRNTKTFQTFSGKAKLHTVFYHVSFDMVKSQLLGFREKGFGVSKEDFLKVSSNTFSFVPVAFEPGVRNMFFLRAFGLQQPL